MISEKPDIDLKRGDLCLYQMSRSPELCIFLHTKTGSPTTGSPTQYWCLFYLNKGEIAWTDRKHLTKL